MFLMNIIEAPASFSIMYLVNRYMFKQCLKNDFFFSFCPRGHKLLKITQTLKTTKFIMLFIPIFIIRKILNLLALAG